MRCKIVSENLGNGNLGVKLCPTIKQDIPLCWSCWRQCIYLCGGLGEWNNLMNTMVSEGNLQLLSK